MGESGGGGVLELQINHLKNNKSPAVTGCVINLHAHAPNY